MNFRRCARISAQMQRITGAGLMAPERADPSPGIMHSQGAMPLLS